VKPKGKFPEIRDLPTLFALLGQSKLSEQEITLYRGHPDNRYALQPSLFRRKERRRAERHILRELIAIQPNEFRDDRTCFEQLVRMQHYGLPTRLLDLTHNPLVALYFACIGEREERQDGALIALTLRKLKLRYFDSDTVSCVANLSNLTGNERDKIRGFTNSATLNKSPVGKRLLHFIMAEKPFFEPRIELSDLKSIHAARPKQTNRRILAQQGAFLIFGLRSTLDENNSFGIRISRMKIPALAKRNLLMELDRVNINGGSLFPEIESAAKYIMSKIPPIDETDEKPD
jgi:FRG domain-containing protein